MDEKVLHEERDHGGSFYIERDGRRIALMDYHRNGPALVTITHTEVDPSLRGGGLARQLFDAAVAWARSSGTKITPRCSYAVVQFARDKTAADVLA